MKVGDNVSKVGGYRFNGTIVAVFNKLDSGAIRLVVENGDGVVHIFSPSQLEVWKPRGWQEGSGEAR